MAHGANPTKDVYFVSIAGLSKSDPEISLRIKHYDDITENGFIEGKITKIELDSYEYEGEKVDTFKLTLVDGDKTYILSSGFTQTGRALLNSLLGLEKINRTIKISVWTKEKDGKVFKNIGVLHGEERAPWKYSREDNSKLVRAVKDSETGKFIKNDYSKLNKKFMDEVESISKAIVQKTQDEKDKDELDNILGGEDDE